MLRTMSSEGSLTFHTYQNDVYILTVTFKGKFITNVSFCRQVYSWLHGNTKINNPTVNKIYQRCILKTFKRKNKNLVTNIYFNTNQKRDIISVYNLIMKTYYQQNFKSFTTSKSGLQIIRFPQTIVHFTGSV